MDYIKIIVTVTHDEIEPAAALLFGFGIQETEIIDNTDFLEFLENNKKI